MHEPPIALIGGPHGPCEGFQGRVLPFRNPIAIAEHDRHFRPASQKEGSVDRDPRPRASEMREHLARGPSTCIWSGVEQRFKSLRDALRARSRLLHGCQDILHRYCCFRLLH